MSLECPTRLPDPEAVPRIVHIDGDFREEVASKRVVKSELLAMFRRVFEELPVNELGAIHARCP
jgi:hypothetical protein